LLSSIPDYVGTPHFIEFLKLVEATLNENVGYMFVILNKDEFKPGEEIEGRIFLDFFIPCFQTKLMLKLESLEIFPEAKFDKIVSGVKEDLLSSDMKKSIKIGN
jgi:hypothetical protein